jgi:hypothetical protein
MFLKDGSENMMKRARQDLIPHWKKGNNIVPGILRRVTPPVRNNPVAAEPRSPGTSNVKWMIGCTF